MTSWAATVVRCEAGLRLRFTRPIQTIELTPDAARQLAATLLVVAEYADQDDPQAMTLTGWPVSDG